MLITNYTMNTTTNHFDPISKSDNIQFILQNNLKKLQSKWLLLKMESYVFSHFQIVQRVKL